MKYPTVWQSICLRKKVRAIQCYRLMIPLQFCRIVDIYICRAFTNRLVRKPPLRPQKNNIIVRKGWRFIDISFLTLLPLKKLRYIFYFWAFTNRLVRKPPLGPQKNNIIVREGWRFQNVGDFRTFFAQRHSDVEFDPSISRTFYQTWCQNDRLQNIGSLW